MTLSSPSAPKRAAAWLDQRLGFKTALDFLRHKTVPLHRYHIWYYFGGVSLFLFGIQVVTGLLLLFYYKPTPEAAFESVRFMHTQGVTNFVELGPKDVLCGLIKRIVEDATTSAIG